MPNHIKNRIHIQGNSNKVLEVFKKFNTHTPAQISIHNGKAYCVNKKTGAIGFFDFSTGIFTSTNYKKGKKGLPKNWEIVVSQASDHFPDFNKILPMPKRVRDWYNWSVKNWGTKWNSYDNKKENENTFVFDTAWDGVPKIVQEMSRQFPTVIFKYEFADENIGYNCAQYEFKAGKIIKSYEPKGGSREAFELAFKLMPEVRNDFVLTGNNYKWVDEE